MGSKWFSKIGIALAGIAMAVGAGVGLGQKEFKNVEAAEAAYYTLSTAKSTQNTGYASTYDVSVTNSEMTKDWNIPGNQNFEGYVRIGGTGLNGENRIIKGKTSFDVALSSITVNHNGIKNGQSSTATVNSVKLNVYSSYDAGEKTYSGSVDEKTLTPTISANTAGSFSFTPTNPLTEWAANSYYVITFNMSTTGSKNSGVDITSIVFYKEVSGAINSVTVKGPENEENTLSITSGVLGFKTVQLSATVSATGGLAETVTWSSDDTSKMVVDSNGKVRIKANGTANITATSTVDDTKHDSIAITSTGLTVYSDSTEYANFTDTTAWGTVTIDPWANNPTVSLTNVKFTNPSSTTSRVAYYSGGLRVYNNGTLTISTSNLYDIQHVIITAITGYNSISTTITSPSVTPYLDGLESIFTFSTVSSSVTFNFKATSRIARIDVYYALKTVSSVSVDVSNASTTSFTKDSTFTASTALSAGIKAIATLSDSTTADVTSSATWNLDTSSTGTATLTATYEGKTSSQTNNVTIIGAAVAATGLSVDPEETTLYVGDTITITPTVTPAEATDKTVSWTSDDETVATVSAGVITAVKIGSTFITVTANGGVDVSAIVLVEVVAFPYSVATSINGGDKVLFTNSAQEKYFGEVNTFASAVAYSTHPNNTYAYTVVAGATDGTVAFKDSDGKYLSWTSGNTLNLYEIDGENNTELTANQSWIVSFDGSVASIVNSAGIDSEEAIKSRTIKFNSDRFACYSNANAANVKIWKLNGESGQDDAEDFATLFMADVVNDICKKKDASFATDMAAEWAEYAGLYEILDPEVKAYIASQSANPSGNVVQKMLAEYNHIYSTYGAELSLGNFLGRTETAKAAPRINVEQVTISNESNELLIAIIIIAGISTLAIGGYFFIRRKHQ